MQSEIHCKAYIGYPAQDSSLSITIYNAEYDDDRVDLTAGIVYKKLHNGMNTPHRAFAGRMVRGVLAFSGRWL